MRKFLALAAALGMILGATAIRPAQAANDEILASVAGTVAINTGACNTMDPVYGGDGINGEAGQKNAFGDVVIIGTFTTGGSDYIGPMGVGEVVACAVTDIPVGGVGPIPVIPATAHGKLSGTTFGTGGGDSGVDENGNSVCLEGTLIPGGQFGTTVAQATATISATWTVHPTNVGGTCASHPSTVLGSGSAALNARVVAIPLGDVSGGTLEDRVEGIVTAH